MDKRKLMLGNSLHKDMQPINQSLERISSISNKQTSPHIISIITQEKSDSFHERKSSDIRSTLKSLNNYSKEKNFSIKGKKRSFYETENDTSEKDNFAVISKVSKIKTSESKQLNNQVSANISFMISQQENIHLSRNSISMTNESLDTINSSVEKSIVEKHKIANPSLSEEASDNFDFSYEYNIKKKQNRTTLDKNTKHIIQDINISHSSPRKVSLYHESSIKTITKSHLSQRKQQDKPKEFQLSESETYKKINDKDKSERYIINKEYRPEKQNFHTSIFSNFLQKCGVILSMDGLYTLSKFFWLYISLIL